MHASDASGHRTKQDLTIFDPVLSIFAQTLTGVSLQTGQTWNWTLNHQKPSSYSFTTNPSVASNYIWNKILILAPKFCTYPSQVSILMPYHPLPSPLPPYPTPKAPFRSTNLWASHCGSWSCWKFFSIITLLNPYSSFRSLTLGLYRLGPLYVPSQKCLYYAFIALMTLCLINDSMVLPPAGPH